MKDRIKSVRMALRLTQDQFASGIDVSRGVIGNIEYGYVEPKENIINRICKTYNVSKDYIVRGAGEMFMKEPLGDRIGAVAHGAGHQDLDAADAFFKNFYADFGEEDVLLMYEIFRKRFPQYDHPAEKEAASNE